MHLPNDSLTFRVKISSDSYNDFIVHQWFGLTQIPETKLTFLWEIGDLSTEVSDTSIRSPPLRFQIKKIPDCEESMFEVIVSYNEVVWIYIPCDVYLIEESKDRTHIAHFEVFPESLNSKNFPKGSFTISNDFYERYVRKSVEKSGKFELIFEFRIRDGQTVSKGFSSEPIFRGSSGTSKFFKSSSFFDDNVKTDKDTLQSADSSSDPDILCDFRSLYSDPAFSDFTLSVGGRSFPVHRSILSARSVVFRAMFDADMREKRESCSEVRDVDANTLDRMLRFVYFNDFADPDVESAAKLFASADNYQIGALRSKCVGFLVSSLSVENICPILSLADLHQDHSLKQRATEFLLRNAKEVFATQEWTKLMTGNLDLAGRLMHEVCLKKL